MPAFSVTCNECNATLKSPKPIPAGKVITCPKCGVMFAAPKPKPIAVRKVEVIDDVEILEDVELVEDEPKGKSTPGKKRFEGDAKPRRRVGKPKRAKMSTMAIILLITGCLAGVAALGVGGIVIWKYVLNAPSEAASYVPNDSNVVFGADVGKIASETSLGNGLDMMLNGPPLGPYFRSTSTQPRSLMDRIVLGVNTKTLSGAVTFFSKSAIDKTQLVQALGGKQRALGSRDGYTSAIAGDTPFLFNTSRSLTFIRAPGNEESVAAQIGKGTLTSDMSSMVTKATGGHLWFVVDADSIMNQLETFAPLLPAEARAAATAMDKDAKCVGAWIRFANPDVQFSGVTQYKSGVSIQSKLQESQKQMSDAKAAMSAPGAENLVQAQFFSLVYELANSATVSVQGDCIVIKAKCKQSTLEPILATNLRNAIPAPAGR